MDSFISVFMPVFEYKCIKKYGACPEPRQEVGGEGGVGGCLGRD